MASQCIEKVPHQFAYRQYLNSIIKTSDNAFRFLENNDYSFSFLKQIRGILYSLISCEVHSYLSYMTFIIITMESFNLCQNDANQDSEPSHLALQLGIALNTEIKVVMNCLIRVKKKRLGVFPFEQIVLCVGTEKIFIFTEKLEKIKFDFGYNNVKGIICEKHPSTSVLIEIEGVKHKDKDIPSIYLSISDRNTFLETFAAFYSAFYAAKNGVLRELAITYVEEIGFVNKYNNSEKYRPLMHLPPDSYKLLHYKNYYFFGMSDLRILDSFSIGFRYSYKSSKDTIVPISCKMLMKWSLEKDVQCLVQDEISKIQMFTQNELLAHINNNFTGKVQLYFYKDEQYLKKYNLSQDSAIWQGWQIRCMLVHPLKMNLILTNIRRKFIPPFFESFSDFSYLCILDLTSFTSEELIAFQKAEHEELNKNIDLLMDSLYIENVPNYMDFKNILTMKYHSLSLDSGTMKHLHNLGIKGYETYKLGVSFIVYVINEVLLKYNTSTDNVITNLKKNFVIFKGLTIAEFVCANEKDPTLKLPTDEDELLAQSKDLKIIFDNFKDLINADLKNKINSNQEDAKIIITAEWNKKIQEYLLFCLDGGIMGESFNLKVLFHCMTIDNYARDVMTNIILRMLIKNPIDEDNIEYCLSSYKKIISNIYTESLLNSVIRYYSLELFKCDSSKFLCFLIEERCSYSLLKAILKKFEKVFEDNIDLPAERTKYFTRFFELTNGLAKIYKEGPSRVNPKISTIACKLLIYLTSHSNKTDLAESLINLNILTTIAKKLLTHDRGLIKQSANLLSALSEKMELKRSLLMIANKQLLVNMNECIYRAKYFPSKFQIIQHILKALENFLKNENQKVSYLADKNARDVTGMIAMIAITNTQKIQNLQKSQKESVREIKNKIMETITIQIEPFNIPYNIIYEVLLYPSTFDFTNSSISQNSKRWIVEIHCYSILENLLLADNSLNLMKYLNEDLGMLQLLSTKKNLGGGKNYYDYLTDVYVKSVEYFSTNKANLKQKFVKPTEDLNTYFFQHFTIFLNLCMSMMRFYRILKRMISNDKSQIKQENQFAYFIEFVRKIDEDVNGPGYEERLINYLLLFSKTRIVENFKRELEAFQNEFR